MYFDNLSDFFNMGGHAPYVWSAFAISLLLMLLNVLLPWLKLRAQRQQLQRQQRRSSQQKATQQKTSSNQTVQQGEHR